MSSAAPIELYYWPTTNGLKISILLEELGLPYETRLVNIREGEQRQDGFQTISASGRIPAIVDPQPEQGDVPLTLFESGAIMLYLAEKTGRFQGHAADRHTLNQWLFWQSAQLAPTLGKLQMLEEKAPQRFEWVIERFRAEAHRVYATLDRQLEGRDYLLGDEVTIADFGVFPWILPTRQGIDIMSYPHLSGWRERLKQRPALQSAYAKGRQAAPLERALVIE